MVLSPNLDFKRLLLDVSLTDKIKYCYQCSRCSDVCPVAAHAPGRYEPRKLIMASYLGLAQLAIGQPDNFVVWGCQVCDTCDEVCPNDIPLTEIFALIKNLSVQAGEAPEYYTSQAKMIYENGKAIPMQSAIERRRDKMGIPAVIAPDLNEIQTILNETKLPDKIGLNKEA
jgi:heterodisulfide reductase subunit C